MGIAPHRLIEDPCLYIVERGKVAIQHDLEAAQGIDRWKNVRHGTLHYNNRRRDCSWGADCCF